MSMLLASCGGGGGGGSASVTPPPPPVATDEAVRISAPSTFTSNCSGVTEAGTLYLNAEVEPHVAIDPRDPSHLIAAWQQNRWSDGSSQGIVSAASFDAGANWTLASAPLSRCTGGNAGNGADYVRATDPWVAISPDGTAYQMALASTGGTFAPGSRNAMLVSRSTDGGRTWGRATALISDGSGFFNDKNTLTADPGDARYAYATWDRLVAGDGGGPTYFARTTDGGLTWEPARNIFDPGRTSQTIGNVIAILADGTLVLLFNRLDTSGTTITASLNVLRSADKGATWSAPVRISDFTALGARDPETGAAIRDGNIIPQIAAGRAGDVFVTWQDARASGGQRDGILLSRSRDGGATWSAPVRVNAEPAVQAFTPGITVRTDGTIGISYYDLRSNTADAATLPTDYWLARSADGVTWQETRISPTFDLAFAPNAGGLFLGDYQGLVSAGTTFTSIFVRANADLANRTDVFSRALNLPAGAAAKRVYLAEPALPAAHSDQVASNLARNLQLRRIAAGR
jgi:hypothetical protein